MPPRPTTSELEILNVLWRLGPSSVRQVHDELNAARPSGYTTTLKLMQIMVDKGLLERDEAGRAHVYRARLRQEETQRQMVDDLVERAFGGSAAQMVMRALGPRRATPDDLREIRKWIDEQEGRSR